VSESQEGMGCGFSYELSSYDVAEVPNWDRRGRDTFTMTMETKLRFRGHFGLQVITDTSKATALVGANAENGLRLVAAYAPDDPRANRTASTPVHFERNAGKAIRDATTFTFMVFQRVDAVEGGGEDTSAELDTKTEIVNLEYRKPLGQVDKRAYGIELLIAKIHELGQSGYALSSVWDVPTLQRRSLRTWSTPVHVIGQRVRGGAGTGVQYEVLTVNIGFRMQFFPSRWLCDMDEVEATIKARVKAGNKLAAIFSPASYHRTGSLQGTSPCVLVFTAASEPHLVATVDINLLAEFRFPRSMKLRYDPLVRCVSEFAQRGWEVAGIIPMLSLRVLQGIKKQITARVVFQARADGITVGGSAPQAGIATPMEQKRAIAPGDRVIFTGELWASASGKAQVQNGTEGEVVGAAVGSKRTGGQGYFVRFAGIERPVGCFEGELALPSPNRNPQASGNNEAPRSRLIENGKLREVELLD
jgi:hypothetical protein